MRSRVLIVSIDLYQLSQRRTGPLTRVLIGDTQPNRWLVGPRCAVLYKEEVGTAALDTRFAAATVSHCPNPSLIEREALLRREAYDFWITKGPKERLRSCFNTERYIVAVKSDSN